MKIDSRVRRRRAGIPVGRLLLMVVARAHPSHILPLRFNGFVFYSNMFSKFLTNWLINKYYFIRVLVF